MRCPKDGETLRRVALAPERVAWGCRRCGSRAVTMPVLRQLMDPAFARALTAELVRADAAVDLPCPSCTAPMRAVAVGDGDDDDDGRFCLHLEVCRQCALVWFDPDELESAPLPAPAPPAAPRPDGLTDELRQQLAIAEVEAMAKRAREERLRALHRLPAMLGMPIELDPSGLQGRPWGTWATAAVVTALSAIGLSDASFLRDEMALVPDELWQRPQTLITSFFVHGDWFHLAGNLWFLVVFGDDVELHYGRRRWLALLAGATVAGGLLHALAAPAATRPCVGASGGISGLIVCYALTLPHARLGLYLHAGRFGPRPRWVTFSARTGVLVWALLQLYPLFAQLTGVGAVSALAHLGGAAVGALAWSAWRDRP